MSHIICPACKGLKKVQNEDGTWVPCEQCSAVGIVHQATGRCEGYVAPEPVEEPAPKSRPIAETEALIGRSLTDPEKAFVAEIDAAMKKDDPEPESPTSDPSVEIPAVDPVPAPLSE